MSNIYHYHPQSGEFLSVGLADESPLEPGVFLIPANATDIEPPVSGERQVACFGDGAWTVMPDWRGVEMWSTADGMPAAIDDLGKTPGDIGATTQPRPSIDHDWKNGEWVPDESRRDARLSAQAREKRDALLTTCDWTQLADAPVDQAAWRTYRQALRDLPVQPGFPADVTWPETPTQ